MSQVAFFIQCWTTDKNFQFFLCINQNRNTTIFFTLFIYIEGGREIQMNAPRGF